MTGQLLLTFSRTSVLRSELASIAIKWLKSLTITPIFPCQTCVLTQLVIKTINLMSKLVRFLRTITPGFFFLPALIAILPVLAIISWVSRRYLDYMNISFSEWDSVINTTLSSNYKQKKRYKSWPFSHWLRRFKICVKSIKVLAVLNVIEHPFVECLHIHLGVSRLASVGHHAYFWVRQDNVNIL